MRQEPKLPSFAKDLLRETPLDPPPPPKSEERLGIEALAKELGITTVREPTRIGQHEGAKPIDRDSARILEDCRSAIRELRLDRDEHKKVTESIDVLIKRYVPFRDFVKAMTGPFPWRGHGGFGG